MQEISKIKEVACSHANCNTADGLVSITETNQLKNFRTGNSYAIAIEGVTNGTLTISSSRRNDDKSPKTLYTGTWNGNEFSEIDITKLQKLMTGKTAKELGVSQKDSNDKSVPRNEAEAEEKSNAWTARFIEDLGKLSNRLQSMGAPEVELNEVFAPVVEFAEVIIRNHAYRLYENQRAEKAARKAEATEKAARKAAEKALNDGGVEALEAQLKAIQALLEKSKK